MSETGVESPMATSVSAPTSGSRGGEGPAGEAPGQRRRGAAAAGERDEGVANPRASPGSANAHFSFTG